MSHECFVHVFSVFCSVFCVLCFVFCECVAMTLWLSPTSAVWLFTSAVVVYECCGCLRVLCRQVYQYLVGEWLFTSALLCVQALSSIKETALLISPAGIGCVLSSFPPSFSVPCTLTCNVCLYPLA